MDADFKFTGESEWEASLDALLLTRKEKSQIIESVMPELTRQLKEATPYLEGENVTSKTLFGKNIGHLRDGVTHKPNQYPDGSTDLGFRSDVYPIAMWTDWGTYRQAPQYWFERKFLANINEDEIFAKQHAVANAILDAKGVI